MPQAFTELKEVQTQAFAASQQWNREFQGRVFDRLTLSFQAQVNTGAAGFTQVFTDPLHKVVNTVEIVQSETPILRLSAQDLYWLGAVVEGAPGHYDVDNNIAASQTAVVEGFRTTLDLKKLAGPLAMIDARSDKVFFRGQFGALTAYTTGATAVTAISATLRQMLRTSQREAAADRGYLRPQIWSEFKDLSTAGGDIPHVIRFQQDIFVPGIMLVTRDDSAGGSAISNNTGDSRVDGLIRNVRVDAQTKDVNGEILRGEWGQLKEATWSTMFSSTDVFPSTEPAALKPQGVVWIPLTDAFNSRANGARLFRQGDALTFHFDTTATVSEEFTAVTPAAGDGVSIVIPGFVPVKAGIDANEPGAIQATNANLRARIAGARAGVEAL